MSHLISVNGYETRDWLICKSNIKTPISLGLTLLFGRGAHFQMVQAIPLIIGEEREKQLRKDMQIDAFTLVLSSKMRLSQVVSHMEGRLITSSPVIQVLQSLPTNGII